MACPRKYNRSAAYGKLYLKTALGYRARKFGNPRINHKCKLIFAHIPKTAGNSVTKALNKLPKEGKPMSPNISKHAKAFEIKYMLGEKTWNEYFSFAFLRNPWDLMVSSYHWWKQKAPNIIYHRRKARKVTRMDFGEFVRSKFGKYMINERCGELFDWISENGEIIVDYVGKVETLNYDWKKICKKNSLDCVEIPHINKSERKPYREYYDEETKRLVAERFHKTIELFGYEF